MIPLKQIKPKSTGVKIKQIKVDISPADPQNSYFKRDLLNIILNLKEKLQKQKAIEPHTPSVLMNSKAKAIEPHTPLVLMNSKAGKTSFIGFPWDYKFALRAAQVLPDHDHFINKL